MVANQPNLPNSANRTVKSRGSQEIPAVVAVVVAKDPGPWFEDMLFSLSEQDYENLSVLVVDAGSADPIAGRVAGALPEAYIHRIAGDPGWSVAANQALDLVSGSPYLLFCHDDVLLERSCVTALMAELYKSNAAIVGPKLVDWDDPRKLLQVGMGADRFGVAVDQIDRGEFDQEQYDSPRDMFFVPGGVQLVRADLLQAVGGFDEGISFMGEDLDLCWRAHAVGARVRVVPRAKAKHIESAEQRKAVSIRRRLRTRHRLRTLLTNSTLVTRLTTVPLAILLIILEGLYALFNGRRRHAGDVFSAIFWNLSRLGSARKRRRQLSKIRKVSDREIRKKQVGGSAQLSQFWREKFEAGQTRLDSVLSTSNYVDSASSVHSLVIFGAVMAILVIGSRGILIDSYRVFGEIPALGNSLGLVREWFGGFRTAGTGGEANAPLAYLILGSIRSLFFFAPGLFDRLLLFAPLLIGYWGASRLARPFGSPRLRSVAGALYVLNPIVFAMMSAGRWNSLVIWASLPFLLTSAFKLGAIEPYANRVESEDNFFTARTEPVRIIRFGFLVAVVATLAPAVVVVAVVLVTGIALASVHDVRAARNMAFAAVAAITIPAVVHFPWSLDIARSFQWDWLVGAKSPEAKPLAFADLLFFRSTDFAGSLTSVSSSQQIVEIADELLVAAGFVLTIAALASFVFMKQSVARLVTLGWVVALVSWVLVWFEARGALSFQLPATEAMMAIAACGLILAVVSVASEYESDFARSVSRVRYVTVSAAGLMLAVVLVGGLTTVGTGRWGMPDSPRRSTAASLASQLPAEDAPTTTGRILWLGDPSVVPADMYQTDGGVKYALTDARVDARNKWVSGPVGTTGAIGQYLDLAVSGGTSSFGRLAASYGVEFVIVSEQLARGYQTNPVDADISAALERQIDLRLDKAGNSEFKIYSNVSSSGISAALPSLADAEVRSARGQLEVDLASQPISALPRIGQPGSWVIDLPEDIAAYVAVPSEGMEIEGVDSEIMPGFDGMVTLTPGTGGEAVLRYPYSLPRLLLLGIQFFLLSSAVIVAQTRIGGET